MEHIVRKTVSMFLNVTLALEINPLVIKDDGNLHCLDAKINIDSNALFRQKELQEMHDPTQEDPRESEASKYDLSYVSLDGNIDAGKWSWISNGHHGYNKVFQRESCQFLDAGGTAIKKG